MWKSGSVFQGLCVWRLSVWNYGTDGSWQETSGGQQCENFATWVLKTDVRCTLNQSGNLNLAFKAKKQGLTHLTIRSSFLWYIIWKHRTPINTENESLGPTGLFTTGGEAPTGAGGGGVVIVGALRPKTPRPQVAPGGPRWPGGPMALSTGKMIKQLDFGFYQHWYIGGKDFWVCETITILRAPLDTLGIYESLWYKNI